MSYFAIAVYFSYCYYKSIMKKLHLLSLLGIAAAAAISLSSCVFTYPISATSNPLGSKIGTSEGMSIFGLTFSGDTGIRQAAKEGGITKISTVDFKTTNILGIYWGFTCIVTGD